MERVSSDARVLRADAGAMREGFRDAASQHVNQADGVTWEPKVPASPGAPGRFASEDVAEESVLETPGMEPRGRRLTVEPVPRNARGWRARRRLQSRRFCR